MKEAVYGYELDLCGREDVGCYSATNPGDNRFDVVRVDAQRVSEAGDTALAGVDLDGAPTTAHSWFPPYAWRNAVGPAAALARLVAAVRVAEHLGRDVAVLLGLGHLAERPVPRRRAPPLEALARPREHARPHCRRGRRARQ